MRMRSESFGQRTHRSIISTPRLARRVNFPNLKPSVRSISIRLPEGMIGSLKTLANSYDVPYQSLIKMLLAKGLENERRKIKT